MKEFVSFLSDMDDKGTKITEKQINHVMDKLNNRPRKCLGIKTPNQVFFGINPPVALAT
jgi:transposase, IS30 family